MKIYTLIRSITKAIIHNIYTECDLSNLFSPKHYTTGVEYLAAWASFSAPWLLSSRSLV